MSWNLSVAIYGAPPKCVEEPRFCSSSSLHIGVLLAVLPFLTRTPPSLSVLPATGYSANAALNDSSIVSLLHSGRAQVHYRPPIPVLV